MGRTWAGSSGQGFNTTQAVRVRLLPHRQLCFGGCVTQRACLLLVSLLGMRLTSNAFLQLS